MPLVINLGCYEVIKQGGFAPWICQDTSHHRSQWHKEIGPTLGARLCVGGNTCAVLRGMIERGEAAGGKGGGGHSPRDRAV